MKKLLVLIAISACAFAGWRVLRGGGDGGETAAHDRLVLDRIWIDHMPKHERDTIHAFVAITDEPVGVFQTASVWKGHYELFRHEAHGDEIRFLFPQDNHRERAKTRARRCEHDGFDYCLELDGASRGVRRYYSRKGWEIDGATAPAEIRARVEAVLQAK
jgi:hypothetical protein